MRARLYLLASALAFCGAGTAWAQQQGCGKGSAQGKGCAAAKTQQVELAKAKISEAVKVIAKHADT